MRRRVAESLLAGLFLVAAASVASAAWSGGGTGQAAARAATVDAAGAPSATLSGRTVELTWPEVTLSNGVAVTGYLVRRYDWTGVVEQTIASGTCAVPAATTSCSETDVPAGTWTYSVTAASGPWRGPESAKTSVTVDAPSLTLSPTPVKSATTLSGSIASFRHEETLRFRLDGASGAELAGTVNGTPTPAPVPAGGSALVTVTIPGGTSEGAHTIYAVASPSGESASVAVTIDDTPPPAPTITSSPAANSSSNSATFMFTDSEAGVSFLCRLDDGGFAACSSPKAYTGMSEGSHTFEVKARDAAGNESAPSAYAWVVDTAAPTATVTFPASGATYNASGYDAGCGTSSTGDFCGTAGDPGGTGVSRVQVSIQRVSTGNYWDGTGFDSATEVVFDATGTMSWSYDLAAESLLADGSYTIRAWPTDNATNIGTIVSSTLTIDRIAPPPPSITAAPPVSTTSTSATFEFTHAEAGVSLECRLDGAAYSGCTSPKTYDGLADGAHTLEIRALDADGSASEPAAYTWTVESNCSRSITMSNFAFTPGSITLPRGCSVTWTNGTPTKHNSTSNTGLWDSGQLNQGQTFTRVFGSAGTFAYRCTIHASMRASVAVN